jgi:hypothetical protein
MAGSELRGLVSLQMYGNQFTDDGMQQLAALPSQRKPYDGGLLLSLVARSPLRWNGDGTGWNGVVGEAWL